MDSLLPSRNLVRTSVNDLRIPLELQKFILESDYRIREGDRATLIVRSPEWRRTNRTKAVTTTKSDGSFIMEITLPLDLGVYIHELVHTRYYGGSEIESEIVEYIIGGSGYTHPTLSDWNDDDLEFYYASGGIFHSIEGVPVMMDSRH